MDLHRFDLNLLLALDALLREKNVTRAAERLYISQPSMSGALQRLRDCFGDQLLVRIGRDMELTPKAQSLVEPVREILLRAGALLAQDPRFHPASARRRFTLVMSDYINVVLMPRVLARLAREAPDVQCHIESISPSSFARLESGDVDLCVMPEEARLLGPQAVSSPVKRTPLFSDRWVCAVAADHPSVGQELSRDEYFSLPHVSARFGGNTMTLEQFTLSSSWANVKVEATAPGFVAMIFMLAGTPLIATVQERLARALAPSVGIKTFAPPVDVPELRETLVWHERNDLEPGHVWLRRLFTEVGAALDEEKP